MFSQTTKVKNGEAQGGPPAVPGAVGRIAEYPRRWRQFLHEVRVEMRQVTWPTRQDVYATTMVVIVTVFFFGFYLFLVDLGVSQVVRRVFDAFRF